MRTKLNFPNVPVPPQFEDLDEVYDFLEEQSKYLNTLIIELTTYMDRLRISSDDLDDSLYKEAISGINAQYARYNITGTDATLTKS